MHYGDKNPEKAKMIFYKNNVISTLTNEAEM
jgi:hypothetical protein